MRKRLRKKKYLGEFREYGFFVGFSFSSELSVDERNALLDDWIENAIEAHDLQFGGGGVYNVWTGYVEPYGRGTVSNMQRKAVEAWLSENVKVSEYMLGPPKDIWHDESEDSWTPSRQKID